jgi:3',5'-cyclic AMP phosphodiesterase CpdA
MRIRRIPTWFPLGVTGLVLGLIAFLAAQETALPNHPESVKFAAIGDMGSGERPQYEVGEQMAAVRKRFPFDFVITLGDNMYGSQRPADFVKKFELPYKPLLDSGVRFYASLGNHDEPNSKFYKLWNMDGQLYHSYAKRNVRFFVLYSDYMDGKQLQWFDRALRESKEDWKIAYFHHPLYSSARRHGSEVDLRVLLEPMFIRYGVNVVLAGHDHVYERLKPQKGVQYFVAGSSGQLRVGDLRETTMTAAGYDDDQVFMIVEIDGDRMWFQAITRIGRIVDSGTINRTPPGPTIGPPPASKSSRN